MAGVYRPRHPERTVLYRVLSHHFDRFLTEYESRFEKEYGFLRPIVKDVVERLPSPAPEAPNAPTRARPPPRAWRERHYLACCFCCFQKAAARFY
jgi:hypothetical protein